MRGENGGRGRDSPGLSLSSHNSSEKKVGLGFVKLAAGGAHLNRG